METIKNYLESMFRGLPLTEKVMKAKSELLQMMEDKYTELIRSGKTENEAVGEVIQNFGNLEDLADDVGLKEIIHQTRYSEKNRRKISFEELTEFLEKKKMAAAMKAAGIMLCIICVVFPIMADSFHLADAIGVMLMFLSIGVGVVLMVSSRSIMEQWSFMKSNPCSIDAVSIDYLKNRNRDFTPSYSVMHSVGILLCIMCFIPAVIFDDFGGPFWGALSGALLFIFVGFGVFLMVYSRDIKSTYSRLLGINDETVFKETKEEKLNQIQNKTVRAIMSAYWSVVTCIYLCVSFLTFKWHLTWLIWPIAAAVNTVIVAIYRVNEDRNEDKTENRIERDE